MLAASRMWRSTPWTLVVWCRPPRAGAPAGKRRLAKPVPLQTTFPGGRVHRVRTFCSRPIPRWPCLIRSGRAEAAVVEPVGVVAAAGAEVRAEALEGAAKVAPVVPAEGPEQAVKAAPAAALAVVAAPAVPFTIPIPTTTTRA